MPSREYMLAADPFIEPVSGRMRREVIQRLDGPSPQEIAVILVVAQDDAINVLSALRRAYQDGREDHEAERAEFTHCSRCSSIAPAPTLTDGLCAPCRADDERRRQEDEMEEGVAADLSHSAEGG